jgi:lauroyl/myristoyl acyltransferase
LSSRVQSIIAAGRYSMGVVASTANHRLQTAPWRRALLWGARHLPPPARLVTMPLWAAIPFVLVPRARRQIAANLARLLGPAARPVGAARAYGVLLSFAQSLANAYAAHGGRGVEVKAEIAGAEHLAAARAGGRGIIVTTGHIGPWQLGPYLLEQAGYAPVTLAMAREVDAGAQAVEELLELRRHFRVVYTDGAFSALELLRVLRGGGLVAVQMDRPSGHASLPMPFAGGTARFGSGPAALARAAEAPLVPVFLLATGPFRVRIEVGAPIEVVRSADRDADLWQATRALARAYEACVRGHPYQWYAFHDFWD